MKTIIKFKTGVVMLPYCSVKRNDIHGFIKLRTKVGKLIHKSVFCSPNINPYIGNGEWYVHSEKPAYLVKFRNVCHIGTREELELHLKMIEKGIVYETN